MYKVFIIVGFGICFSLFYIFTFLFSNSKVNNEQILPKSRTVNLASLDNETEKSIPLPIVKSVKEIHISNNDLENKMKPTPLTFSKETKTVSPRLTAEEIKKAKIVKIIPMRVNGENMEMVVVEKDGLHYDASDGVMVFMPENFKEIFKKHNIGNR